MARKIVVLENNLARQEVMRQCLEDRCYQWEILFFDEAKALKNYLEVHLPEIALICLNHDLELKTDSEGMIVDPGTGREVADFLAGKKAVCPVVIHTTNAAAAVSMKRVLQKANWPTYRVCSWGDLEWIPGEWFRQVDRLLVGPIKKEKSIPARGSLENRKRSDQCS